MIETATVKSVTGTTITLGCSTEERCESCSGGELCNIAERVFDASNPRSLALEPGDRVAVYLAPGRTVFASLALFVFPLLAFLAGYLLALHGLGARLLAVAIGFGAFLAALVAAGLYLRRSDRRRLPEITELRRLGDQSPGV